jgi:DNA-directed RNA polymerase subunit RPC12/RpoP
MSGIVSYSKCSKCKKILNIGELTENELGIVCVDTKACEERVEKQKNDSKGKK